MDYQVTEGVSPRFVRLMKEGEKSLEKKSVGKCCISAKFGSNKWKHSNPETNNYSQTKGFNPWFGNDCFWNIVELNHFSIVTFPQLF